MRRLDAAALAAAFGSAILAAPSAAQEPFDPDGPIVDFFPPIIFFHSGSSRLDPAAERWLGFLASHLAGRAPPGTPVFVLGHADAAGPADANLAMSCRRAVAAARRLAALGVAPSQIFVLGFGEAAPLVAAADGVAEAQNRRVEFRIGSSGDTRGAVPCDAWAWPR